jgi:hypothetical protein
MTSNEDYWWDKAGNQTIDVRTSEILDFFGDITAGDIKG